MKSRKIKILILISSVTTSRMYLILLKKYLQKKFPESVINYFISQHDVENTHVRQSVYAESEKLKKDVDILIGLDGYLPKDLLKYVKGEKYLIHLPEIGYPTNMTSYVNGYDHVVVFGKEYFSFFKKKCQSRNIEVLLGEEDFLKSEMSSVEEKEQARKELIYKHPQIAGKRIISITTRGVCKKKYIEKYKNINLRKILKQLPEDIVLMSNCAQIELASATLPQKYADRYISFGQRELLDVLRVSEWNYTNIGLSEKTSAKIRKIAYSDNEFEKGKNCIKLWKQEENFLTEFESD